MSPAVYNFFVALAVFVSLVFCALVFFTGKGDAMSGGGGVRTTYKGKASIEDKISQLTLGLGIAFMALMLVLDLIAGIVAKKA